MYQLTARVLATNSNTAPATWESNTTATIQETALYALLGMVQALSHRCATTAGTAAAPGALVLEMYVPEYGVARWVAYPDDNAGPDTVWEVYAPGGMLADGSGAHQYPNPVAAALALGAQAMALLLNP